MMNFTLVTTVLCTFSLTSVSVSEFHTVEVQPGEDVTLVCTNFTSFPSHIHWFRLGNGSNSSCISSMFSSDSNITFYDGFQNGKFKMASNTTTIFLKIKQVDLSESGLYFCGFASNGNSVIVHATYVKVQEVIDGLPKLISVILGGLFLFLIIVIISLVVKIRKLHLSLDEGRQNPQPSEDLGSDALNYAALRFKTRPQTNHRSASEIEMETNVVYAATR